mmetsp:Transcript_23049/g.51989  ORF Transcript_23049/g.51989 Transcript_23049/m.51989 type:complete len:229 (+) Transcript_23049:303-989(+)
MSGMPQRAFGLAGPRPRCPSRCAPGPGPSSWSWPISKSSPLRSRPRARLSRRRSGPPPRTRPLRRPCRCWAPRPRPLRRSSGSSRPSPPWSLCPSWPTASRGTRAPWGGRRCCPGSRRAWWQRGWSGSGSISSAATSPWPAGSADSSRMPWWRPPSSQRPGSGEPLSPSGAASPPSTSSSPRSAASRPGTWAPRGTWPGTWRRPCRPWPTKCSPPTTRAPTRARPACW